MINLSELNATLKDFINQFGLPNDSNSRMYISLLKEGLANNPLEAHLLELSIQEKIPQQLFAQKDNIQAIFPQIIQVLCNKYQIDSPSAEWTVQVWLDAFGLKKPSSSYQKDNQSNQPRKAITPPNIGQNQSQIQRCDNCGKNLPENAEFCPYCGSQAHKKSDTNVPTSGIGLSKPQIQQCNNCGKNLPENAGFCPYCGSQTNKRTNNNFNPLKENQNYINEIIKQIRNLELLKITDIYNNRFLLIPIFGSIIGIISIFLPWIIIDFSGFSGTPMLSPILNLLNRSFSLYDIDNLISTLSQFIGLFDSAQSFQMNSGHWIQLITVLVITLIISLVAKGKIWGVGLIITGFIALWILFSFYQEVQSVIDLFKTSGELIDSYANTDVASSTLSRIISIGYGVYLEVIALLSIIVIGIYGVIKPNS